MRRALLLLSGSERAPAFVAKTDNTFSATTTVTITVPPEAVNGDELLAFVGYGNTGTITGPAGWTLVRTSTVATRSLSVWKRIASDEPASYDWTLGTSGNGAMGMVCYRPATAGDAVEVEAGTTTSSSTDAVAPSVTAPGSPRLLIVAYVGGSGQTVTADPPGMTQRINRSATARLVVYDEALKGAGATGTRTATLSAASSNAGHSMILRGR